MGLHPRVLESVDERRLSWLRECIEAFASVPAVTDSAYVRRLVEVVLSLAGHGGCILVGRGAAEILPPATTVRVRVVAPVPDRIAATRHRLGVSQEEAARWVEETDRERDRFVRDHFHKDPADVHLYDLVLNSGRLSVEECAELIEETLRRFQARDRTLPALKPPSALAAVSSGTRIRGGFLPSRAHTPP
jgi:cytidylate kinase